MLMVFGTLVSGAQPLMDQPNTIKGLRLGETLEYNIKVKGIPAGNQVMQIKDKRQISGREVYHLESKSIVNKFFNLLYPFSDQIESFVVRDGFYPLKFKRELIDGEYKGNTTVDIDDSKRVARVVKDNKRYELNVPKGIQDELSMLYLIRMKNMEIGKEYEFPAIIGIKYYKVGMIVLRSEKIKTIFGYINTIVVKSIPRDVIIWITQDNQRIPVKLEVNTKIGKLVAELKAIS